MRRLTALATPVAHLIGPGKLKVVNTQLAFSAPGEAPFRLDPRTLRTVYCYGAVGITDEAVQVLCHHQIQVAWLTPAGTRCKGRLVQDDPSTTSLRMLQHRVRAATEHHRDLARWFVTEKIQSQLRALRHHQRQGAAAATAERHTLTQALEKCAAATTLDQLRGLEGLAAAGWFRAFGALLRPPWSFPGRVRRPPTDPVNALLSLSATWLLSRTVARCQALGLEVYLGFLHAYRAGRPSLACDLMEPLRAPAVERWVLEVCNRGHVKLEEFVDAESAGIRLRADVFPRMLHLWESHWLVDGPERLLDEQVQAFVSRLRGLASSLPPLTDEEPEPPSP